MSARKSLRFAKAYFIKSEDRRVAILLLIGAILTTIAFAALVALIAWWSVAFWAALVAFDAGLFLTQLLIFAGIVTGIVVCQYFKRLIVDTLDLRWRTWLTKRFIDKFLPLEDPGQCTESSKNRYIDLLRYPDQLPFPQQRIQEDIATYTKTSLSLSLGLLDSVLTLGASVGTLWVIGGALSFVLFGSLITIPGFLVWAALLFSGIASLITYKLGKRLPKLNRQEEAKEAAFRQTLELVSAQSEYIGQEKGEHYFQPMLKTQMDQIAKVSQQKVKVNSRLSGFESFYTNLSEIFPYLATSPLYFSGAVELGVFMQIGFSFMQVHRSVSWFVNSFEEIATFKASAERLLELEMCLTEGKITQPLRGINFQSAPEIDEVKLSHVDVSYPGQPGLLFNDLNLTLKPGEHTLIEGDNGSGKSTLFKIFSGTWKYGKGNVSMPQSTLFFSQRPTMPVNTLRAILAYPHPKDKFNTKDYLAAINRVGLDVYSKKLDAPNIDWGRALSGGEQEKIGFARALLTRPKWLFLDEATAALTEENETRMYRAIQTELPDTTIVSIGHRSGIKPFHQRVLFFSKESEGNTSMLKKDERLSPRRECA
ncbi:MAG: ATP-binding cassette domain-containing protein [Gammaproteobacteria bacterium]|nr:ATP-binding cassette domain-containing protein [Gammaproteobacteria bacterium]